MKIGILTFHCAHNYGAVLQCYGLQEYLKSQGHEVSVVDYKPDYLVKVYLRGGLRFWVSKNIIIFVKRFLTELFLHKIRAKRYDSFSQFINTKFNLTPYNQDDNLSDFNALVLGSDQIWNPAITNGSFDDVFFAKGIKCKTIAYAASMGRDSLSEFEKDYITKSLKRCFSVGVREHSLNSLLSPLTSLNIQTVLDPTLLAGSKIFDPIASKAKSRKPYVLLYQVDMHDEVNKIAKHIAKQINGEVIELVAFITMKRYIRSNQTASPEDFVGLIKHATCVVTTSFHGTAFSVIFNKPFYTIQQQTSADLRSQSLLNMIGLNNRFIPMNSRPTFTQIDFTKANKRLAAEVEYSEAFIKTSLKNE